MAVERNRRKTKVGIVTSDKMDKTVVVAIEDFVRHSLYGKAVKRTKRSRLTMRTTNAISEIKLELWKQDLCPKDKRWRLVNIIEKVK